MQDFLYLIVSFFASAAGAICGIGGGVIIKPVLDMIGSSSVSTISFLSGCTVLAMSCYSVGKSMLTGEKSIDTRTGTPLAIGAAVGGVWGKQLFSAIERALSSPGTAGGIQAMCLAAITVGTLIYTVYGTRIHTHRVQGAFACVAVGIMLGVMSSFLGIGGGPINLVVLYFFFSMDTKTAATNSLYIILFSQITSLAATLLTRSVPDFRPVSLVVMVAGGISGGIVGRQINKRIDDAAVKKLFIGLMTVIVAISIWNSYRYLILGF